MLFSARRRGSRNVRKSRRSRSSRGSRARRAAKLLSALLGARKSRGRPRGSRNLRRTHRRRGSRAGRPRGSKNRKYKRGFGSFGSGRNPNLAQAMGGYPSN